MDWRAVRFYAGSKGQKAPPRNLPPRYAQGQEQICLRKDHDAAPFVLTLCFFAQGFAGLEPGIWPTIVPPSLTIRDAASPPSSQGFVLAGLVVLLPPILGYTSWSYNVFKGRIQADSGYR